MEGKLIIKKVLLLIAIWCSFTIESLSSQERISGSNLVDLVIVGSDRTTFTGDVCNKIGTYLKALAAKDNNVLKKSLFQVAYSLNFG